LSPGDILVLIIENGIAIAGFSGIVVVLGRRQSGEWTAQDRLRLRGLLNASFTPMSIAGLALIMLASKVPSEMVWRICSSVYALLYAIFWTYGMRLATSLEPNEINRTQIFTVLVTGIAVMALLIVNAITIASFWPLAIGLVYHTVMALFNFVGLLMRAISDGNAA